MSNFVFQNPSTLSRLSVVLQYRLQYLMSCSLQLLGSAHWLVAVALPDKLWHAAAGLRPLAGSCCPTWWAVACSCCAPPSGWKRLPYLMSCSLQMLRFAHWLVANALPDELWPPAAALCPVAGSQDWASVLFKRKFRSLRSFPFFIKKNGTFFLVS